MSGIKIQTLEEYDKLNNNFTNISEKTTLENYLNEIQNFKKTRRNSLPFVNQNKVLDSIVSRLATSYPYTVLVGEPGIGKTLTLDFLVDIFEGRKKLVDYSKDISSKTFNTIEMLNKQLEDNSYPDTYLFLPQFDDLTNIRPFTYSTEKLSESNRFDEDFEETGNFISNLKDYFKRFTLNNIDLIRFDYDKKKGRFKSNKIYEEFIIGLEEIRSKMNLDLISSDINNWVDNTINYFTKEKSEFNDNIISIFDSILKYQKLLIDNSSNNSLDSLEDFLEKSVEEISTPDSISTNLAGIRKEMNYMVQVSNFKYDIDNLLIDNILEIKTKSKVSKLGNLKDSSYIGIFDGISDLNPPHMSVFQLGSMFSGPLIYIKDDFKNFIDYFSKNKDDTSSKERFLDWLQTGKFVFSNDGIKYTFDLPKLIIGSDNSNPFEFSDGLMSVKREEGLESRIKMIEVESYAQSNNETRAGTLKVIYDTLDKYNKEHSTNITFDDKVVSYLLNSTTIKKDVAISLKYRDLENTIKELSLYAQSGDLKNLSLKELKLKKKDDLKSTYFMYTDLDFFDLDGITYSDAKNVGFVNGLAIFDETIAGAARDFRSNLVFERLPIALNGGSRFINKDIESKLREETAFKGFELSKEFLTNYLSKIDKGLLSEKLGWYVSTQVSGDWGKGGGPSASTAITASIISALSGTGVYKNRFITGTLNPTNQTVGAIGGVYQKGTVAYRYKELSKSDEDFYFMFPSSNLEELRKELLVDPLGLENSINMIPVRTFAQAYELLTNPNITLDVLENSHTLGSKRLENDLIKIENNLKDFYMPRNFFGIKY